MTGGPYPKRLEGLAVAAALGDRAKQRVLVSARRLAPVKRDAGQEILVAWIRRRLHRGSMPEVARRDAKGAERRAAADDEGAVIGIDDGKPTGAVRAKLDGVTANSEEPRLRVVTGGSEDCVAEQEPDPLLGIAIDGIVGFSYRPWLQRRVHVSILHGSASPTFADARHLAYTVLETPAVAASADSRACSIRPLISTCAPEPTPNVQ